MATGGAIGDFSPQELRSLVEAELEGAFSLLSAAPTLIEAARYGVFPGGKRIRPVMALALCADLGGDPKRLAPGAIGLELVHCASLIHDDLPALDNDDFRRGRPACHRAFSEASAILAGDLLIAFAHECVVRAPLGPEARMMLTQALARACVDLCAGQELDLIPAERREDLLAIHALKTGALFGACAQFGVIGAGRSSGEAAQATELGRSVGVAFQIVDDFLDVYGSDAARGRPGSSDSRNGKENLFTPSADGAWELLANTERKIDAALRALAPAGAPRFMELIKGILVPLEEARAAHRCVS